MDKLTVIGNELRELASETNIKKSIKNADEEFYYSVEVFISDNERYRKQNPALMYRLNRYSSNIHKPYPNVLGEAYNYNELLELLINLKINMKSVIV